MANRSSPHQLLEISLLKNLPHQTHPALRTKRLSIIPRRHNPRTLLPPMLQGIQPVIRQLRRVRMIVNSKYPTLMRWDMGSFQDSFIAKETRFEKGEIFILFPKLSATIR